MKGLIKKLDQDSIDYIAQNGGFIDSSPGGLVIGKTHAEGGITMVRPNKDGKTIDVVGEMEHGEFIMSAEATKMYKDRLYEINSDTNFDGLINIDSIRRLKNILFTGKTFATIVFASGEQFIINHKSTAKYIDELERLNEKAKYLISQITK